MEQVFESVKDIEKQIAGFISQDEKTAEAVRQKAISATKEVLKKLEEK